MSDGLREAAEENERLRSANEHLRERVGELESLRVEWQVAARQQAARADAAEDMANGDRQRADAMRDSIREAQAAALREAAQKIRHATHDRLQRYEGAPKETASLAIDGTIRLLERLADEAEH